MMWNTDKERLYRKILGLIDSDYLRDYLMNQMMDLSIDKYIEIIAHAPTSLARKVDLISRLSDTIDMVDDTHKMVSGYLNEVNAAMERLQNFDRKKSLLILQWEGPNTVFGLPIGNTLWEAYPVSSYKGALKIIQETFNEDEVCDNTAIPPSCWKLHLYDILPNDSVEHVYEYVCEQNGEVQYYRHTHYRKNGFTEPKFFGNSINLPVPYKPGDILYIDGAPYRNPAYCLIISVGDNRDCCCVQCLYPNHCGFVSCGAFKQGHYQQDNLHFDAGYIGVSPLFRAELYRGELPEEYDFMKPISRKLKQDPSFGESVLAQFFKNSFKTEDNHYAKARLELVEKKDNSRSCASFDGVRAATLLKTLD